MRYAMTDKNDNSEKFRSIVRQVINQLHELVIDIEGDSFLPSEIVEEINTARTQIDKLDSILKTDMFIAIEIPQTTFAVMITYCDSTSREIICTDVNTALALMVHYNSSVNVTTAEMTISKGDLFCY